MKVTEEMIILVLHQRIKTLEKAMNFMHDSRFLPYLKEHLDEVSNIVKSALKMVDEYEKEQAEGKE